jgi:sugar phosphate isomerase/epimerase
MADCGRSTRRPPGLLTRGIPLLIAAGILLAPCARGSSVDDAPTPVRLQVSGTRFVRPDGTAFSWRGVTAFRLLEFVAHGREADADAYLRWTASKGLNVVRVLAMMQDIFELSPEEARRSLPRLLDLAARRNTYVEVVALAGTANAGVDPAAHVAAVGRICAAHDNCILELANEPGHPSQATALHDPAYLQRLARLVPANVLVSLGSVEYGDAYGAGSYVTWHPPRTAHWVERLVEGKDLLERFGKPVVADEPTGAADAADPGRRDNDPAHFRAAARLLGRMGVGATFHYEGGMHARLPTRTELACLDAWLAELR